MKSEGTQAGSNVLSVPVADLAMSRLNAEKDDTAELLSRIWRELLGIDTIAVDQNFFDLGGDSSLAVRMFSQIEDIFGVKLPLATLYEAPTIAYTSIALGRVWQTNDQACWQYVPQPYAGAVTDFRPSTQYRIFNKPDLKWDSLAQGGQEVIVLPVNPASMLVEPFVEHLAAALRRSMDAAMVRCSAGYSSEARNL